MTRWSVDMAANSDDIAMTPLSDLVGEFPRIDDRFAGQANRYGWQLVQFTLKQNFRQWVYF